MKEFIILVGAPGSGKTTYCEKNLKGYIRVSQDDQGKIGQWEIFEEAIKIEAPLIVVDRMNTTKEQREKYLVFAKDRGYTTKIINFVQVPYEVCLKRVIERENHPTIKKGDERTARIAISTFFSQYENVLSNEADEIEFISDY